MATYFAAESEGDAVNVIATAAVDDETLTTAVAPESDAFAQLIELVYGQDIGDLGVDQRAAPLESVDAAQTLVRIGRDLRDTVADYDEEVLQTLAEPWSASGALGGIDVDAVDFLTDLQHLCRHARAIEADVYAVAEF